MPWFRVDDGFAFHRKALRAGNAPLGLWVRAGSWCAQQLTDGQVPEEVLSLLGGSLVDAQALVSAGLWDEIEGGYQFRGWHEYQPTRAEVEEERAKARQRQKEWRKNRRNAVTDTVTNAVTSPVTTAVTHPVTDAVSHGGSNGAPSLPFPSLPKEHMSEVADAPSDAESDDEPARDEVREDVERVCRHLVDVMVANGCRKPSVTNRWRDAARLMIDKENREPERILRAIDWAWGDDFWRGKIESLPKLRVQYDKLRLAAGKGAKSNVHSVDFGAPKDPANRPGGYASDDVRNRWQS